MPRRTACWMARSDNCNTDFIPSQTPSPWSLGSWGKELLLMPICNRIWKVLDSTKVLQKYWKAYQSRPNPWKNKWKKIFTSFHAQHTPWDCASRVEPKNSGAGHRNCQTRHPNASWGPSTLALPVEVENLFNGGVSQNGLNAFDSSIKDQPIAYRCVYFYFIT